MRESTDPDSVGVALVARQVFGGRPLDRDHVVAIYEAHVAEVLAAVPADWLLVHKLGDGSPPHCAHLGVPAPDCPYPRRNSAADFEATLARARDGTDRESSGRPVNEGCCIRKRADYIPG